MGETFRKKWREGGNGTALFLVSKKGKKWLVRVTAQCHILRLRGLRNRGGGASSPPWCGYLPIPLSLVPSCID